MPSADELAKLPPALTEEEMARLRYLWTHHPVEATPLDQRLVAKGYAKKGSGSTTIPDVDSPIFAETGSNRRNEDDELMLMIRVVSADVNKKVIDFLTLLEKVNSVVADSPVLNDWRVADPTGDFDNEVVFFSWEIEGERHSCALTERAIIEGKWVNSSFFCADHEGEEVQISLYSHEPVMPPRANAPSVILGRELANEHGGIWGEHPEFPIEDWQYQVANGDTRSGYWDWCTAALEAKANEQGTSFEP